MGLIVFTTSEVFLGNKIFFTTFFTEIVFVYYHACYLKRFLLKRQHVLIKHALSLVKAHTILEKFFT